MHRPFARRNAVLAFGSALLLFTPAFAPAQTPGDPGKPPPPTIDVKRGTTPRIDGVFTPGEWDDAGTVTIEPEPDWKVTVRFKHDEKNLFVAFTGLKSHGSEMYPEVLLDTAADAGAAWGKDDWWLHASYQDCEGQGRYNVYDCKAQLFGWKASNFPLNGPGIEIGITYGKMGLKPADVKTVGIAFDVTDTERVWRFWPPGARLESPATWGRATSSDGWR